MQTETKPKLKRSDPNFPRIATGTIPPGTNHDGGGGGGCGLRFILILIAFFAIGYLATTFWGIHLNNQK